MPYRVGAKGSYGCSGYPALKEGTNEVMGCHKTRADAARQIYAINRSEGNIGKSMHVIKEGDFVMGMTKEGMIHGMVEHIMTEGGTLGTPGSEYALESMPPENPAMSVRIYKEEEDGWEPTAYSIGMMHNDAEVIDIENHSMENKNNGMDAYDNSIGKSHSCATTSSLDKAYEGCGCPTCKKLNVNCENCPVCLMDKAEMADTKDCKCNGCMECKAEGGCNMKVCKGHDNMYKSEDVSDEDISKSYQSDDEEMDKWDNMTKACWVGYTQQGMKEKDGRMVPNCVPVGKSDSVEKAESVSVGNHVTFAVPKPPDKTESAHGVVERVERSGKVKLPGTNESVEASSDNPVAVIRVYATDENGKRTRTDRRVVKPFSSLRVSSEPIDNEKMYDEDEMEKVSAARLQELADAYNKNKEGDSRITVGALRQVYNRGIGAYRTNPSSVRGSVSSAEQWAMGRVNAFMAGLRGRFPRKPFDLDLFPKGHPRSTKKSLFEDFAKEVQKPERVTKLFKDETSQENIEKGWGGSIFDLNPFKK